MRVLVFDDDEAISKLVVKVAIMSGMEATAVTDAEVFREQLESNPPQVIVLDLQLSGTDGVEQMRVLADRRYTGAVVLMSGHDPRVLRTAQARGQSLGLKVEYVREKPLRVEELEKVFERLQSVEQSMSGERLLEAIANDELVLNFQPVVTRNPKVLKKFETLIRWQHPVLGKIPPGDFLPTAESSVSIIDALTDWVVGAAVDAYQVLTDFGVKVPLAVNISKQNFHDLTLPDRLERRLQIGGMPARHLCLEISEGAVFKDAGRMMDILSRMRLKGMQLSIDDFGTGYSSLKMLRQMPFSEIKIDQSFVADVTTSSDSRAIVKSIIDLAANMQLGCVAEGVDSAETADFLEKLGVRDLQGYFIARPMPLEAIPEWLATDSWCDLPGPGTQTNFRGQDLEISCSPRKTLDAPALPPSAKKSGSDPVRLSPRQLEVMQLLSEGCAVKEIAYQLKLGISTVKVHLSLAYSALGVHNRTDAIRRAGSALVNR